MNRRKLPPWVWLYGPSGVGKSAIGEAVFGLLSAAEHRVGHVELDQVDMVMPAAGEARAAARADNLLGMLANLAGRVDGVVVSGDVAGPAMDDVLARSPVRPVLCRLRADQAVVVERLTARGSPGYAEASATYDTDHVVPPGDIDLTTHPAGVDELAAEVVGRLGDWPQPAQPRDHAVPPSAGAEPLRDCGAVLVTGPRAVGKSTVAWKVFMRSASTGVPAGYLDLAQMSLVAPAPGPGDLLGLQQANVATCWEGLRRQGARRLVLCGQAGADGLDHWRRLAPGLHVAALTAGRAVLLERARRRAARKEIWLPGDDLFGRADDELAPLVDASVDPAAEAAAGADQVVATDDLTAAEAATRITCW